MNKTELVAAIVKKAGWEDKKDAKKNAEALVNAFTETVAEALKDGDKVQLIGFGTFEISERKARTGRNPRTGESMKIKASKAPKFKPGKAFKDAIN